MTMTMTTSVDEQISRALSRITEAVKSGEAARVRAVLRDLLETRLPTTEQTAHQLRLAEIGENSIDLARYLGELGISEKESAARFGRGLKADEKTAYEEGVRDRKLAVRAVELATTLRGGKLAVPEWMQR